MISPATTRLAMAGACLLAGCGQAKKPPPVPLRVGVTVTKPGTYAPVISLTGDVEARVSSDLSFTSGGQIIQRLVDVGDHVISGQALAAIDPQQQRLTLQADQASVESAEAKLRQATAEYGRQSVLIRTGDTTRVSFDNAFADQRSALASLQQSIARRGISKDQLDKTVLRAPEAGIVTERHVEVGRVVEASQSVYTLALDGPRDAVFDVNETVLTRMPTVREITITMVSDPKVHAIAHPREIAPLVDSTMGTVKVKCEIQDPPAAMTLGAALTGSAPAPSTNPISLPWSALATLSGRPAIWVVDPANKTASLKPFTIAAYAGDRIIVASGLQPGQTVVTQGAQLLSQGETVTTQDGPQ